MILLYGNGKFLKNKSSQINWSQVAAIIDKNAAPNETYHEVNVAKPEHIQLYDFDSIYIFSPIYFEEIKLELIYQQNIPEEMVFSWNVLLEKEKDIFSLELPFFKKLLSAYSIHSILDVNYPSLANYVLTKSYLKNEPTLKIDGICKESAIIDIPFYGFVYSSLDSISEKYDLALIHSWSDQLERSINFLSTIVKYIVVYLPYQACYDDTWQKKQTHIFEKLTKEAFVHTYFSQNGLIYICEPKPLDLPAFDLDIYVVLHKKFKVLSDDMYHPLCVGRNYTNPNFLNEHTGKNIAHLNGKINECTAMYWIWKNTNSAYVGLNHYRRYFYNDDMQYKWNFLTKKKAHKLLTAYDIILAKSDPFANTVFEQFKETIKDKELFDFVFTKFCKEIKEHQGEYLDAFHAVMQSHNFFRCNLFLTKRFIFNSYCEWLFSFLLPIAEEIDLSNYEGTDSRILGFFAERMLSVWLYKQNYSMMELCYTDVF